MAFDTTIAAMTVWMEARGEGPEGRRAVAHVLHNRLCAGRFGATLAEVCLAPLQFSAWNTTDPNRRAIARADEGDPVLLDCAAAVREALGGAPDPTVGATFYFATGIAPPAWSERMTRTVEIGRQIFLKE
jgi:spore germination cell wall hydrolase CwlJ-like protein